MFALISQGVPGGRLGALAPQLYANFKHLGYGAGSPFKAITAGDNGYYKATGTYNPATGLGSLDIDVLANLLGASTTPTKP